MARHLAGRPTRVPALILCSPARRTRETLEPLRRFLGDDSVVQIEDALYLAGAGRLLERLRELPDEQPNVLLIGHDPGLHDLALALATPDRSRGYQQLREKFPTGALVEFALRLPCWRDLAPGTARLVAFTRPRDLG